MVVSRGKKWGDYYKLPPTDYYWEIRIRHFSTVYDKDFKPEFPKPAEYYLASPDPKYPTYWQDMLSHENTGMGMYEHIQRQKHC